MDSDISLLNLHDNNQTWITKTSGPYLICSSPDAADFDLSRIADSTGAPPALPSDLLGGRGGIRKHILPGIGPVIIKSYVRGGMIRYFSRSTYLGVGKSRCQRECENLLTARNLGVNAPDPVAFITRGRWIYQAWLITREIPHGDSLATLSLGDEEKARAVLDETIRQLAILVNNRIFHVDFHPGNVLIGYDGIVYFIDFDKARNVSLTMTDLCEKYMKRWDRAVKKYHLPSFLSDTFYEKILKGVGLYS